MIAQTITETHINPAVQAVLYFGAHGPAIADKAAVVFEDALLQAGGVDSTSLMMKGQYAHITIQFKDNSSNQLFVLTEALSAAREVAPGLNFNLKVAQ
jgi:hypothetical protein